MRAKKRERERGGVIGKDGAERKEQDGGKMTKISTNLDFKCFYTDYDSTHPFPEVSIISDVSKILVRNPSFWK